MLFLTTEHRWPIAFTLGLSLQMDLMGTVNDTIKYRIGNGRFADNFRPFLHRNLAGNQDRLPAMTPLCGKACKDDPLGGKSASSLTHLVWLQKLLFVVQRWKGKRG